MGKQRTKVPLEHTDMDEQKVMLAQVTTGVVRGQSEEVSLNLEERRKQTKTKSLVYLAIKSLLHLKLIIY